MAMDDRVIEAAAKAYGQIRYAGDEVPEPLPIRDIWAVEAAVTAALRALEPELRAAVERLMDASEQYAQHFGYPGVEGFGAKQDAARRAIFALLGLNGDA
jgi:hypothetical protein